MRYLYKHMLHIGLEARYVVCPYNAEDEYRFVSVPVDITSFSNGPDALDRAVRRRFYLGPEDEVVLDYRGNWHNSKDADGSVDHPFKEGVKIRVREEG
jgi:hypothetical protein